MVTKPACELAHPAPFALRHPLLCVRRCACSNGAGSALERACERFLVASEAWRLRAPRAGGLGPVQAGHGLLGVARGRRRALLSCRACGGTGSAALARARRGASERAARSGSCRLGRLVRVTERAGGWVGGGGGGGGGAQRVTRARTHTHTHGRTHAHAHVRPSERECPRAPPRMGCASCVDT